MLDASAPIILLLVWISWLGFPTRKTSHTLDDLLSQAEV